MTEWFKSHNIDLSLPQKVKYDNPVAEDYKEKLTCLCEDRVFEEREHLDFDASKLSATSQTAASATPGVAQSREGTPLENRRSATPANSSNGANFQKEKNEAYLLSWARRTNLDQIICPLLKVVNIRALVVHPQNLHKNGLQGPAIL